MAHFVEITAEFTINAEYITKLEKITRDDSATLSIKQINEEHPILITFHPSKEDLKEINMGKTTPEILKTLINPRNELYNKLIYKKIDHQTR